MRSEGLACPVAWGYLAAASIIPGTQSWEHAVASEDPVPALQDECKRLQLLVGELVLKNHELRSQVMCLREKHEFSG
jgi:hypothetical protein